MGNTRLPSSGLLPYLSSIFCNSGVIGKITSLALSFLSLVLWRRKRSCLPCVAKYQPSYVRRSVSARFCPSPKYMNRNKPKSRNTACFSLGKNNSFPSAFTAVSDSQKSYSLRIVATSRNSCLRLCDLLYPVSLNISLVLPLISPRSMAILTIVRNVRRSIAIVVALSPPFFIALTQRWMKFLSMSAKETSLPISLIKRLFTSPLQRAEPAFPSSFLFCRYSSQIE